MTHERSEEKTYSGWRATTAGPRRITIFTTKTFAAEATPVKRAKDWVWILSYSGPERVQLSPTKQNPRRYWSGYRFTSAHEVFPTAYKAHCAYVKECRWHVKQARRQLISKRRELAKAIRRRARL